MIRRVAGDGFINLKRAKKEVAAAFGRRGSLPLSAAIEDAVGVDILPSSAILGRTDRELAEIDHDGFAFAVSPEDVPYFNRRSHRHPRQQHLLDVVQFDGHMCVRKRFRPPRMGALRYGDRSVSTREWLYRTFWVKLGLLLYNEAASLLRLRDLPFVPQLRGLDLPDRALYIDYVEGESLRHQAAASGQPIHDIDVGGDPELARMSSLELDRREVALLDGTCAHDYRGEIKSMVREINMRGVAPLDIKLGNFLRGRRTGRLYWIDFEMARLQSQPGWDSDLERQERMLAELFGIMALPPS